MVAITSLMRVMKIAGLVWTLVEEFLELEVRLLFEGAWYIISKQE